MREIFRSAVALLAAFVVSVSGRSLSDFHLLTDSTVSTTAQPSVQSDQGASLATIHTWEEGAALPVTSPPARAPPNAALTSPSLQLPSNNASTAASVLAGPPARTAAPPNQAPLRGVPSPGLLAQIANFPGQSDTTAADSTNSSAAVGADGSMMAVLERIPEPAGNNSCIGSSTISNSTVPCVRNISMDSTEAPLVANSSNITPAASMDSSNTSSRSLPAAQPGDPALHAPHLVPDRCIIAGSSLFSSCAAELSEAQAHFNISMSFLEHQNYTQLLVDRGITQAQVLRYLRTALASPSDSCCAAQCCFNQLLLCDCEPSVVEVAVRFAGVDKAFYSLMSAQLARSCGIKHFYGDTCPISISYPASTAAACTGSTAWPPVRDRSPTPNVENVRDTSPTPGSAAAGTASDAAAAVAEEGPIICLASSADGVSAAPSG